MKMSALDTLPPRYGESGLRYKQSPTRSQAPSRLMQMQVEHCFFVVLNETTDFFLVLFWKLELFMSVYMLKESKLWHKQSQIVFI